MYSNARYYSDKSSGSVVGIRVNINGVTSFVPLDPANTDYQNIMKLVEDGKLTIESSDGNTE